MRHDFLTLSNTRKYEKRSPLSFLLNQFSKFPMNLLEPYNKLVVALVILLAIIFSLQKVDECILWLSIICITILCTPQPTVVRWSASPPVSEDVLHQWKGFCAIIANAYYMRGMAWLPVKTLQLEQMAVAGYAEEPSVVASRMRLVFSTLEVVSPQWPQA